MKPKPFTNQVISTNNASLFQEPNMSFTPPPWSDAVSGWKNARSWQQEWPQSTHLQRPPFRTSCTPKYPRTISSRCSYRRRRKHSYTSYSNARSYVLCWEISIFFTILRREEPYLVPYFPQIPTFLVLLPYKHHERPFNNQRLDHPASLSPVFQTTYHDE